jgi:NAD(P)-dependent dehydrogenase (short-subunit alcohol dehydrogenase family)
MSDYVNQMFGLEGKIALVAGASSGIGAEFARALARAGADVVLGARRADRIEALAKEIAGETGRRTLAVAMDVTDGDSVTKAFDEAEAALGTVNIVCNNAGLARPNFALQDTEEDWDVTMNTNLKGMWRVAREAANRMMEAGTGGSIINTASILGLGVAPTQTTYCVSKAGVVQMTKALALEWQRFGIRVNALCPGYFKTEINDQYLETEQGQKMVALTPAKRVGKLEELVPAMLMFACDASGFTTGVALPVDGAHTVRIL